MYNGRTYFSRWWPSPAWSNVLSLVVGGWSPRERRAMGKKIVRSSITQSASQSAVKVDFHCRVIFTCNEVVAILVYRTNYERIKLFLYAPLHFFASLNQHSCWSWEWKGLLQAKGHLFAYLIAFSDLVVEPVHPHLPRPLRRLTTKSLLVL